MSPVTISKVKGGYQVRTPNQIHAKHTSLANAKAQERIINAHEHTGWKPTGKPARKKKLKGIYRLMGRKR